MEIPFAFCYVIVLTMYQFRSRGRLAKKAKTPITAEAVSKLGLLSLFVRVSSCALVDCLFSVAQKKRSTKSHAAGDFAFVQA